MYKVVITINKTSFLCLYLRIFIQPVFRWLCFAGIIFLNSWGLGYILVTIFQCQPIASFWDKSITNPNCVDTKAQWLSYAIINIVCDALILIMPLYPISQLRLPRAKRFGLAGIIALGALYVSTSPQPPHSFIRADHRTASASLVSSAQPHSPTRPITRPRTRLAGPSRLSSGVSSKPTRASSARASQSSSNPCNTFSPTSSAPRSRPTRQTRKAPGPRSRLSPQIPSSVECTRLVAGGTMFRRMVWTCSTSGGEKTHRWESRRLQTCMSPIKMIRGLMHRGDPCAGIPGWRNRYPIFPLDFVHRIIVIMAVFVTVAVFAAGRLPRMNVGIRDAAFRSSNK